MEPKITANRNGSFRIWDHPADKRPYVAGADVAEGRKRDRTTAERRGIISYNDSRPDYSAIIVLDEETAQHVASWHGYVPPNVFATICAAVGHYYNTALLVPELNGPGLAVVTSLDETIRYPNIYRSRVFNVMDRDPHNPRLGWQTNEHSRKILMNRINEILLTGLAFTRDRALVAELRTMEFDDNGKERGRGRNKDDRVLALAMALQGRYEAVGGLWQDKPPKLTTEEALNKQAWDFIRRQQENRSGRSSSGDRLFAGWAPRARARVRR